VRYEVADEVTLPGDECWGKEIELCKYMTKEVNRNLCNRPKNKRRRRQVERMQGVVTVSDTA
jgi:hypothetical protein